MPQTGKNLPALFHQWAFGSVLYHIWSERADRERKRKVLQKRRGCGAERWMEAWSIIVISSCSVKSLFKTRHYPEPRAPVLLFFQICHTWKLEMWGQPVTAWMKQSEWTSNWWLVLFHICYIHNINTKQIFNNSACQYYSYSSFNERLQVYTLHYWLLVKQQWLKSNWMCIIQTSRWSNNQYLFSLPRTSCKITFVEDV